MSQLLPSGGLAPQERLLWSSTRSALYYFRRLIVAVLIFALSFAFVFFPFIGGILIFPLSFPLYIFSLLLGFSARASARAHRYFITSSRVIEEHLVLGKRVNEAPIDMVAEVQLTQGMLERLLGYGSLSFRLVAGGSLSFKGIRRPELAREAFLGAKNLTR